MRQRGGTPAPSSTGICNPVGISLDSYRQPARRRRVQQSRARIQPAPGYPQCCQWRRRRHRGPCLWTRCERHRFHCEPMRRFRTRRSRRQARLRCASRRAWRSIQSATCTSPTKPTIACCASMTHSPVHRRHPDRQCHRDRIDPDGYGDCNRVRAPQLPRRPHRGPPLRRRHPPRPPPQLHQRLRRRLRRRRALPLRLRRRSATTTATSTATASNRRRRRPALRPIRPLRRRPLPQPLRPLPLRRRQQLLPLHSTSTATASSTATSTSTSTATATGSHPAPPRNIHRRPPLYLYRTATPTATDTATATQTASSTATPTST